MNIKITSDFSTYDDNGFDFHVVLSNGDFETHIDFSDVTSTSRQMWLDFVEGIKNRRAAEVRFRGIEVFYFWISLIMEKL